MLVQRLRRWPDIKTTIGLTSPRMASSTMAERYGQSAQGLVSQAARKRVDIYTLQNNTNTSVKSRGVTW